MNNVLGVSGHRPQRLGGYSDRAFELLVAVAIEHIVRIRPDQVITGMALGWDQAIAEACIRRHIPFWAAVPFKGQDSQWPAHSQRQYARLLTHAQGFTLLSEDGYSPDKLLTRNKWIVDRSNQMLVCWDGIEDNRGGTFHAVRLTRQQNKPIVNAYSDWQRLVHTGDPHAH